MPVSPGALLAGDLSGELDASLWVAEAPAAAPAAYRPRQPQTSALYKLLETLFEQVKLCWEERFEPRYGPWRGFFDSAVATLCDQCRHPRCRPQLRVVLDRGALHYLLDLNATSARNLIALEDELSAEGLRLEDSPVTLSVVSRGHWPEVRFERP